MVRYGTFHIIWNSLKSSIYSSLSIFSFLLCFSLRFLFKPFKFQLHGYEFGTEEEWRNKKYVWPTYIYTEIKSNKHFVDQNVVLEVDWVAGIVIKRNLDWLDPWASIYFGFNNSPSNQRMRPIQLQFCDSN